MSTGQSFAILAAATLVLGACTTTADPPRKAAHTYSNLSTCFGVNTDFFFTAEKYDRPWLSNSSAPFTFANLFDFALRNDIERNVKHARLQLDGEDSAPRILFLSSSNEAVFQSVLGGAHVECTDKRTVVKHTYLVHGADSFGGSERTVTVTFTRADELTHATSRREGVSRSAVFFMFPVTMKPVETWAQFRQSR